MKVKKVENNKSITILETHYNDDKVYNVEKFLGRTVVELGGGKIKLDIIIEVLLMIAILLFVTLHF